MCRWLALSKQQERTLEARLQGSSSPLRLPEKAAELLLPPLAVVSRDLTDLDLVPSLSVRFVVSRNQ